MPISPGQRSVAHNSAPDASASLQPRRSPFAVGVDTATQAETFRPTDVGAPAEVTRTASQQQRRRRRESGGATISGELHLARRNTHKPPRALHCERHALSSALEVSVARSHAAAEGRRCLGGSVPRGERAGRHTAAPHATSARSEAGADDSGGSTQGRAVVSAGSAQPQSGSRRAVRSGSVSASPCPSPSQRLKAGAQKVGERTPPLSSATSSRGDTDRGSFQISANGGRSPRVASGTSPLSRPLTKACNASVACSDGLSERAIQSSGKSLARPPSTSRPAAPVVRKREMRPRLSSGGGAHATVHATAQCLRGAERSVMGASSVGGASDRPQQPKQARRLLRCFNV